MLSVNYSSVISFHSSFYKSILPLLDCSLPSSQHSFLPSIPSTKHHFKNTVVTLMCPSAVGDCRPLSVARGCQMLRSIKCVPAHSSQPVPHFLHLCTPLNSSSPPFLNPMFAPSLGIILTFTLRKCKKAKKKKNEQKKGSSTW